MLKRRLFRWSLFLVLVATMSIPIGCGGRRAKYGVAIKNETGEAIDDVDLTFGGFKSAAGGYVADNGFAFDLDVPRPVPDKARLAWKGASGAARMKEVDVLPLMPKSMDGITIFFVIHKDGNVTVTPLTKDEQRAGKPPFGKG